MPYRLRIGWTALVAILLVVLVAGAADAAVVAKLRVVTPSTTLESGTSYVTGTERIRTDPNAKCFVGGTGGSGDTATLAGPTAMGLLASAGDTNTDLDPLSVTDEFGFGLGLCGIGGKEGNANRYWAVFVNHKDPGVGGDQVKLHEGDEVLWYLTTFPPPPELVLHAPSRAKPGAVGVEVVEHSCTTDSNPPYETTCSHDPAVGAVVTGGSVAAITDSAGQATVPATAGNHRLVATLDGDIPSAPLAVCVNSVLSKCPAQRGEQIVGRPGDDDFAGTPGWDRIRARGGDDVIHIGAGGHDRVRCGAGRDRVLGADGNDSIAADCEVGRS